MSEIINDGSGHVVREEINTEFGVINTSLNTIEVNVASAEATEASIQSALTAADAAISAETTRAEAAEAAIQNSISTNSVNGVGAITIEAKHFVGAAGEPAFQNGWGNFSAGYAPCSFYKDSDGIVHLEGMISGGIVNAGDVIFTLPEGYVPADSTFFGTASANNFGIVIVNSGNNNGVSVFSGSNAWVALNGISFRP